MRQVLRNRRIFYFFLFLFLKFWRDSSSDPRSIFHSSNLLVRVVCWILVQNVDRIQNLPSKQELALALVKLLSGLQNAIYQPDCFLAQQWLSLHSVHVVIGNTVHSWKTIRTFYMCSGINVWKLFNEHSLRGQKVHFFPPRGASLLPFVCVCSQTHTPTSISLPNLQLFVFFHAFLGCSLVKRWDRKKKMGGWASGVKSPPRITPEMEHKEIIWLHPPWLVALKRAADLNGISCYQWRNLCQEMWGILGITLPLPPFFFSFPLWNRKSFLAGMSQLFKLSQLP